MKYSPGLQQACLLRRYKRFLADVELPSGDIITIHCPNTGSMKNCIVEGSPCWYSVSDNPKRKYPYTWEIATSATGGLAGINTGLANRLVKEALENGVIPELSIYSDLRQEVKYGEEGSRIDFLLSASGEVDCYLEVKSVTLGVDDGKGLFPDAVSQRASKHLRELIAMRASGFRAVLLFCVQHNDIRTVSPADKIDPTYGSMLREAIKAGVEVLAYAATVSPESTVLNKALPFIAD